MTRPATKLKTADLRRVEYSPANARRAYRLRRKVARGDELDGGERAWLDAYQAAHPSGTRAIARRQVAAAAPATPPAPPELPRDDSDAGAAVVTSPPPLTVLGAFTDEEAERAAPAARPAPQPAAQAAPSSAASPPGDGPPPLVVDQPASAPDPKAAAARARTIEQATGFITGVLLKWDREIEASGRASFGEEYLTGMFAPAFANVLDHFMPAEVSVWGDVALCGVTGVSMWRMHRQIGAARNSGISPKPAPPPPKAAQPATADDGSEPAPGGEKAAPWL